MASWVSMCGLINLEEAFSGFILTKLMDPGQSVRIV